MLKSEVKEIELELTGVCNLHCPICSRNFVHSQFMVVKNIRPLGEIIEQLEEYPSLKTIIFAGTLSEPTLYPQFLELVEYCNNRNLNIQIFTNGNTHNNNWWMTLGYFMKESPKDSRVVFTVCGSTQELHEHYRVGSKLNELLDHAAYFKVFGAGKDYCQHILFEYNKEDYDKGLMQPIFNKFSHHFQVTAEYRRRLNEKITEPKEGIQPPIHIKSVIDCLFQRRKPIKSPLCINCRSLRDKKVYINQFGRVFPCFTHAEFEDRDFKDDDMNYDDILAYNYPDCWLCSQDVDTFLKPLKIDIVC